MKPIIQYARIAICLLLAAVIAFSVAACSDEAKSDSGETQKSDPKTFQITGLSMEPTLKDGQTVEYTPSDGRMPASGDIILFTAPGTNGTLAKRVIAVAGQELRLDYEEGKVYVDGKLLDESGYATGYLKKGDIPVEEINGVIPDGKVFVLGDRRDVSIDSRNSAIGMVDVSSIIGTVIVPDK